MVSGIKNFACPWYDPLLCTLQVLGLLWRFCHYWLFKAPLFWIISVFSLVQWVNDDYYGYLAVGRGGTPSTFLGWCQTKVLHFIATYILMVDVFGPPFVDPMFEPLRGVLFNLPPREGPRTTIIGLVPQRQGDQRVSTDTEAAMIATLERKAAENPQTMVMGQSYLEGHLRALKRRLPAGAVPGTINTRGEWGGEVVHTHKLDGSAHVILHPADAAEVVRAGYGERHPLSCCAEYGIWRFYHNTLRGTPTPLPNNFLLVYAPRSEEEMAMFERIVDAAVWFHSLPENGETKTSESNKMPAARARPNAAAPGQAGPAGPIRSSTCLGFNHRCPSGGPCWPSRR